MIKFTDQKSIGFDDVFLIPKPGKVESRQQIPLEGHRIVVAGMSSIICHQFLWAVHNLPDEIMPTIHIPRDKNAVDNIRYAKELGLTHIFIGVGLEASKIEEVARECGYFTLLIDIASGYLPQLPKRIKELKSQGFKVITGSVNTAEGCFNLVEAGTDIVRSGLGTGAACITSNVTGFGRGKITEIIELNANKFYFKAHKIKYEVLSDGGFKNSGDLIKSFLSGADYCMSGFLFTNCKEARMHQLGENHTYFGQASSLGKQAMNKEIKNIEGTSIIVPLNDLKPLKQILEELWDSIRSAVSYSGYSSLTEAVNNDNYFELRYSK